MIGLYPLIKVTPAQFATLLENEPKQLGKPILQATPIYWAETLWKEKAEQWYWPTLDGVIPVVEPDSKGEWCAYVDLG